MFVEHAVLAKSFEHQPGAFLSVGLLGVATALLVIALFGHPVLKAAALAWTVLP